MKPDKMRVAAGKASDLLKSLANPHRLMIICQLVERARSVGELAQLLGLRPATVSQHLTLLRKDDLVTTRRDGQVIWYSIASAPARKLMRLLYGIYCGPAAPCVRPEGGGRDRPRAGDRKRLPPPATPQSLP